jgi:hypothetical protein
MTERKRNDPRIALPRLGALRALTLSAWLAGGLVVWELLVHFVARSSAEDAGAPLAPRLAIDAAFFVALSLLATATAAGLGGRLGFDFEEARGRAGTAALLALMFAALMVPGAALRAQIPDLPSGGAPVAEGASVSPRPVGALLCSPATAVTAAPSDSLAAKAGALLGSAVDASLPLQVPVLPLAMLGLYLLRRRREGERQRPRGPVLLLAATGLCATCTQTGNDTVAPAPAASTEAEVTAAACPAGAPVRSYDVSAINVSMTLNRFGDRDPGAFMYALDSQIPAIRAAEFAPLPGRVSIGLRNDPIQPLVIRANLGDCLVLHFTNRLGSADRVSLHVDGLPYTAVNGGGAVGYNQDSYANPGQSITYHYCRKVCSIPRESPPRARRSKLSR